jgi:hypothetical protein
MKRSVVIALFFVAVLCSCNTKEKTPDVSNIKVDLPVHRFERDLFSLDLQHLSASLDTLYRKYPSFFQDYLSVVMAYDGADTAMKYIPLFVNDSLYTTLYKDATLKFGSFDKPKREIERGVQFLKYYFPEYPAPAGIITFIGPVDGIATGLSSDHNFAIGLQGYMGRDYPAYQTSYIAGIYPAYKSRKFEPEYIPVNCMMSVIEDMYPTRLAGRPLIEQMIEAGKKLYVLDKLLPATADTLKTGYTKAQLDGAYENEANIWGYFITNNLLYTNDPIAVRDYMNEAPNTTALGAASPGFIGQFVGWQIVKKWMSKTGKSLEALLKTPAKQIFDEAKYKPG